MAKFKTRARAIDMLGRQQIAGIPTAINELFKNAHDAYADRVEVDYFRNEKVFLLRDDGRGMTKEDFLNRWLVLGTESKVENARNKPLPVPEGKEVRPILGEKGIGRLSIAAIGKQVLIISRANRNAQLANFVVALIHWGIFEIPGLDLDQIDLPVHEFEKFPTVDEIKNMREELAASIESLLLSKILFDSEAHGLLEDINNFSIVPEFFYEKCPTDLSLENHEGTQFFISPVVPSLNDAIDSTTSDSASKIEKLLIGFTNTMTPDHPTPLINVAFRDHKSDYGYDDVIDENSFFTPEDFKNADHHFVGNFDEYGQFLGQITIYNKHHIEYKIPWQGNNYKETSCGSFSIECSYLQGVLRQSTLDPIRHAAIKQKTDRFGGLYIYKDGVRILPYGDHDYDFLDIEKNRTKSASYYFFSYRRMFGVINITRENNSNLVEKAGREGLIENKAYKQIQDILKNFFVQLAADFFREAEKGGGGIYTEYWENIRSERERIYKAIEKRNKQANAKKENFSKELTSFFVRAKNDYWNSKTVLLQNETEKNLYALGALQDTDEAAQKLIDEEVKARQKLNDIRMEAKLKSPRGFSPTREQRENWEAYLELREKLESETFLQCEEKLMQLVNEYRKRFSLIVNNRKRIQKAVELISEDAKHITAEKRKDARKVASEMAGQVRKLTQDLMERVERSVRDANSSLTTISDAIIDDQNIQNEIYRLEQPIIREKEYATEILESIISQIENIFWEKDKDGKIITNQNIADSLEEEVGELRNKVEADAELIQLGLAVNIVHHEFANAVKALRSGMRTLKNKADIDKKLQATYSNLQANFSHLDHYLSLLTPFNRRLNQQKEMIKAEDIYIFMQDVFSGRLERHNVSLRRSKMFAETEVLGYRSVLYPVFANLVDNAIYWLIRKQDNGEKVIRLHADSSGSFYISNNGEGIPIQDTERIFELGYSRKPNGRGMGLAISRDVLRGVGYELSVDKPRQDMNVTFKISLADKEEKE